MLAAGERGRGRVLPAAPEPCPGWAPPGWGHCQVCAHTDGTGRPSVAIRAAQHFCTALTSPCLWSGLHILPSLPSFGPCRAHLPSLMVRVPPGNAIPLGCVPGGIWEPPIPNFSFSNQFHIFQGKQEPVGAQPGCGGEGSCGCSQGRSGGAAVEFQGCFQLSWAGWGHILGAPLAPGPGLGWAPLPSLVLQLVLFHIPEQRRLIADPQPTTHPNPPSQCSSFPRG